METPRTSVIKAHVCLLRFYRTVSDNLRRLQTARDAICLASSEHRDNPNTVLLLGPSSCTKCCSSGCLSFVILCCGTITNQMWRYLGSNLYKDNVRPTYIQMLLPTPYGKKEMQSFNYRFHLIARECCLQAHALNMWRQKTNKVFLSWLI